MLWLDADNAAEHLRRLGWIESNETVRVSELTGGVSNQVLYVAREQESAGDDFVLKQARPQLRTPQPWFSPVERIWREIDVLRLIEELVADEAASSSSPARHVLTPRILHEDRDNFAFAMTAAPPEHEVWKRQLLAGTADSSIAEECGQLLGRLHGRTWRDARVAERLGDARLFDSLRIDPYYRTVAALHPEYADAFERLIISTAEHRLALVHADFSPKNLLVFEGGLMVVDFETGHFGDPAFDLGFFTSHLVLKSFHHAPGHSPFLDLVERFWNVYRERMSVEGVDKAELTALEARGVAHFAGCAWSRLDGKSRVDYLDDEPRRNAVRALCRWIFDARATSWAGVLDRLHATLEAV